MVDELNVGNLHPEYARRLTGILHGMSDSICVLKCVVGPDREEGDIPFFHPPKLYLVQKWTYDRPHLRTDTGALFEFDMLDRGIYYLRGTEGTEHQVRLVDFIGGR